MLFFVFLLYGLKILYEDLGDFLDYLGISAGLGNLSGYADNAYDIVVGKERQVDAFLASGVFVIIVDSSV